MSVSPSVSALPSIARLLARGSDPARTHLRAPPGRARRVPAPPPRCCCVPTRPPASGMPCPSAGLETLTLGPWLATARGAEAAGHALVQRSAARARLARDRAAGTGRAAGARRPACWCRWWAPNSPVGLLLLALPPGLAPDLDLAATIGDAMVIALDRARTADELALHRDVRDLMETFARGGASTLTLMPALEAMCRGVARLTAADVVEVWHHDRRAQGAGPGGDIGPAARDRRGRQSRPRI